MSKFNSKLPIIISSNNSLFRDGLSRILSSGNYNVVASTSSLRLLSALKPDDSKLLVIGAGQDAEETLSQIRMYRDLNLDGYIVIVAQEDNSLEILPVLRAGAHAYLSEDTTSDVLLKTIELVMLGGTVVPRGLLPPNNEESFRHEPIAEAAVYKSSIELEGHPAGPLERSSGTLPRLSPQEKRVLSRLIVGESNKRIAQRVDIAELTVKVHVKAIFRKFQLKNRTHAAVWALNEGSHILNSELASEIWTVG